MFLKDLNQTANPIFQENLEEVIEVYNSLDLVILSLQEIVNQFPENMTLDDSLLYLKDKILQDKEGQNNVDRLQAWIKKYCLGDGSLKGTISFYNKVKDSIVQVIRYKDNQISIADTMETIKFFNELYPLPGILNVTMDHINKEFDNNMIQLQQHLDPSKLNRLQKELNQKIMDKFLEKQGFYEKSEKVIKEIIKRIENQGDVDLGDIRIYQKKLGIEMQTIREFLDQETFEIDSLLSEDDTIDGLINKLQFFYKKQQQVNIFNITSDIYMRNEVSLWDMVNYKLIDIDKFGNMFMHGMLPTKEENGSIIPVVNFRGRTGIKAVSAMEIAVRKFYSPLSEVGVLPHLKIFTEIMYDQIGDALEEVNSWYSDITKTSKASEVNKILKMDNYGKIFEHLQEEGTGLNSGNKPMSHPMLG